MTMRRDLQLLKRIETSKLILLVSYLISISLTLIVIIGTFTGYDMDCVTQIALGSYAEISASNIFYFKKATRENVFKHLPADKLECVDINNLV